MPEHSEAPADDQAPDQASDHGDQAGDQESGQEPEEFLNRAARRAQRKGGGARLDRSAAQTAGRPARAGGGPSRQFTNRRTGG